MNLPSRRRFCGGLSAAAVSSLALGIRPAWAAELKAVFFNAAPPLSFEGEAHEIVGILPDILTEILGKRLGLPVNFQGLPWARAQAMVQQGEADALCTVPTPARLDYAVFTQKPVIVTKTELFYWADNPRRPEIEAIRTLDQLRGFRQGDYIGNGFAEATFKGLPVEFTPTLDSVFRKIAAGHLDLYVGADVIAKGVLKPLGLGDRIRSFPVDIGPASPFCIGIRKSFPDAAALIERADQAVAAAGTDGSLASIIARYIS